MRWQKRARLAIAAFGVAFAGVVFFAVGERERPAVPPAPIRLDPAAIVETSGCELHRMTGTRLDFTVTCDRQVAYEGGEAKLFTVRIEVKDRHGRDFAIKAAEAVANDASREIALSGDVRLTASDGFELSTAAATFREHEGVVRTPGAVTFRKGAMSGTGVGMTYDKNTDVLTIMDQARVRMVDADGNTTGEFAAGGATLARVENYLALDRTMHALRGAQTIDAGRATAHLTENEEALTALELRGGARVAGGSSAFDVVSARDIDLTYAGDGATIERVALAGGGSIAFKPRGGTAGRRMVGESLTVAIAPDGSVTSAVGRGGTRLDLPAEGAGTARDIGAKDLDATGEPGKGLTGVRFSEDVEYRERTGDEPGGRSARSQRLRVTLDGDALDSALFEGRVRFADGALTAAAAAARYDPARGQLRLSGADAGGGPQVADDRIAIDAEAIDVTLQGPQMTATGGVKTRLQGSAQTSGLLDKDRPTHVTAASLRYDGAAARAVFAGTVQLVQGETAMRADTITVDQGKGNLSAVGSARATLAFGGAPSVGRGDSIAYENAARQLTIAGAKPLAAGAPAAPGASAAHLSGPEGDLQADRIVVTLHPTENRLSQLDGYDRVTLRVDQRLVTGAAMRYYANGRYDMTGVAGVPVTIVEGCRQTTARTLTFFKSTDNIVIDGNEEIRTRTTSGGPCPQPLR